MPTAPTAQGGIDPPASVLMLRMDVTLHLSARALARLPYLSPGDVASPLAPQTLSLHRVDEDPLRPAISSAAPRWQR